MATIPQILQRRWFGNQWSIVGDDYSTLTWLATSPDPKPLEAAVRAFSAEVDAEIVQEALVERQSDWLRNSEKGDYVLRALEIIMRDALLEFKRLHDDIEAKVRSNAITAPLSTFDSAKLANMQALWQKIQNARNVT